jgi:hypothetical protein
MGDRLVFVLRTSTQKLLALSLVNHIGVTKPAKRAAALRMHSVQNARQIANSRMENARKWR